MQQKILIVKSMNLTPEAELEERLQELGEGWHVVSATTSLALHGNWDVEDRDRSFRGVAKHVYYVTTVVLERAN